MASADHIAELYAVPPAEFTAARNRMTAELRKRGRTAEAQAVSRLRKPSAALWAVNRLASTDGKELAAFIDAVDRLRRSQLRDPSAAADALRAQRAALDALLGRARDALARSGLTASQAIVRRISDTLMGAAIDRGHASALRRGRLTTELPPPGFEAFGGARVSGTRLRLVPTRQPPVARSGPEGLPTTPKARPDEAERRRRALEAEQLQRQATDQERAVTQLEAEQAQARAKVAEVQERLRMARDAARHATAAARRARRNAFR
jgi:hypothetical protein